MRHTKGHTANRRSHHALSEARYSTCANCKATHVRHHMCPNCGTYQGRAVIDVKAREERRLTRRKEKLKAMGEPTSKAESTASSEK
ncbi:MAG TPA: 50S ribosomal protein L32 [Candidatus Paceibacterota bacterium]|nr:50S ribosomal protein L32 [Candidatus Paceibacterota bacterium]